VDCDASRNVTARAGGTGAGEGKSSESTRGPPFEISEGWSLCFSAGQQNFVELTTGRT
jgi:hypothetical protein